MGVYTLFSILRLLWPLFDSSNFHHIETLLKEPAGCLVSKVMKPQTIDTSPRACPAPCALQCFVMDGEDNLITPDVPR